MYVYTDIYIYIYIYVYICVSPIEGLVFPLRIHPAAVRRPSVCRPPSVCPPSVRHPVAVRPTIRPIHITHTYIYIYIYISYIMCIYIYIHIRIYIYIHIIIHRGTEAYLIYMNLRRAAIAVVSKSSDLGPLDKEAPDTIWS